MAKKKKVVKKKNKKKTTLATTAVASAVPKRKLKIMVSSTVYGKESELDAIAAILKSFGYDVVMSKNGTLYIPIGASNEEACLKAVKDCDLFLGIIFPRYGSGITHKEIELAVKLNKPRWFIAHYYVTFAREILKQYMFRGKKKNKKFKFKKTDVMDSHQVIYTYNVAIQNHLPIAKRKANWAHPFWNTAEIQPFLETQFKDYNERENEIAKLKRSTK